MMRAFPLEDFAATAAPDTRAAAEDRLHAYEEGYKAGWDDANSTEAQAQDRISAEFSKTLEDMTFGYHEARGHILASLAPLLTDMVARVLPTLAEQGFARTVADTVLPLAEAAADQPLELRICPENASAMARLLDNAPALPVTLVKDDTLGPGQALVSSPRQAREIDIDAMLAALKGALDDFLTTDAEEARHHG